MKKLFNKIFGRKVTYTDAMFVGEFGDLQKELTEYALQIAREGYGINLDFSHKSIERVGNILGDIHEDYIKTGDTDGLNGLAMEFGFYVAATIQKMTNTGHLERNHSETGADTYPFYWKGNTLFPYIWCKKHILEGESDSVSSKYKALVLSKI